MSDASNNSLIKRTAFEVRNQKVESPNIIIGKDENYGDNLVISAKRQSEKNFRYKINY